MLRCKRRRQDRELCSLTPVCCRCCPCHHPAHAATQTGEYSINLLLWHKHLLYNEEHHTLRERLSDLTAGIKGLLTKSKA